MKENTPALKADTPSHLDVPGETPANSTGFSDRDPAQVSAAVGVAALAAMRLKIDGAPGFRIGELHAVELIPVAQEIPRYLDALVSARGRLAKKAKLEPETMPILLGIAEGEIVLTIATPQGKDPNSILAATKDLCNGILEKWRDTSESASHVLLAAQGPAHVQPVLNDGHGDGDGDNVPDRPSLEAGKSPEGSADEARAPDAAVQIDPLSRRLLDALVNRSGPGSLSLNFASAGQPDSRPAIVVPPAPPPPMAAGSPGEPREIVAQICRRSGAAQCLLRELGGSAQKKAGFSTSSSLGTFINMLAGCPPVILQIRDLQPSHPKATLNQHYIIERVVGLTAAWCDEPAVLDHLQSCVDELRQLLPAPKRGTKE